jgi:cyanophycinase
MLKRWRQGRRPRAAAAEEEMGGGAGSILAVGGAEDKVDRRDILERFVHEAGGARARIAILPTASEIPVERAAFYREVFAGLGVTDSVHVPIATREDAEADDHARAIDASTAVFLTGGDQTRLVEALAGTKAFTAIRGRLRAGGVLAGTSAGASAFSSTMIVGGPTGLQPRPGGVRLAPGLGVITRLIIDQHFSQRDRLGRLLTAVALEPERLGVGIDEDTAIVYYGDGQLEVIGSGQVFVVDAKKASIRGLKEDAPAEPVTLGGVTLHVLTRGDRFDVVKRRLVE